MHLQLVSPWEQIQPEGGFKDFSFLKDSLLLKDFFLPQGFFLSNFETFKFCFIQLFSKSRQDFDQAVNPRYGLEILSWPNLNFAEPICILPLLLVKRLFHKQIFKLSHQTTGSSSDIVHNSEIKGLN